MLYEALTEQDPFSGPTAAELYRMILHADPIRPRILSPNLPADLEVICLRALEKEPARPCAAPLRAS